MEKLPKVYYGKVFHEYAYKRTKPRPSRDEDSNIFMFKLPLVKLMTLTSSIEGS